MLNIKTWNEYGSQGYSETWGYVAPDGSEYALISPLTGTACINLEEDPLEEVGFVPGSESWWHDTKTYKTYAYGVADQGNQGIQIFDLSTLPGFFGLTKTWRGEGGNRSISQVHNLYIDTVRAMMYATGQGTRGVHFIDITDPLNPATRVVITGETHDMCVNPDGTMLVQATGSSSSLAFWDITDLDDPSFLVAVSIGSGYSHQCWFHEDGIHMATTIETTGSKVKFWDISGTWDGNEPELLDEWIADESIIAHNVFYEKDLLWVSHYTAGTWVLDVRDHTDVKPLGHHDPATSSGTYDGTWGVYPWLPSGRVIHTDGQRGLFVFEPDPAIIPLTGDFDPPNSINTSFKRDEGFSVKGLSGNNIVLNIAESGNYRGSIYNTAGTRVYSKPLSARGGQALNIQDASLNSGNYIFELNDGVKPVHSKFIVKK